MAFWLEMKTEYWDALPVQYLRRTGAYGKENAALMAEMKNRITKKGSGRKILPYGQCLGTIPIQHLPICAATMYAPKGCWICLSKHFPAENISFLPCPTPQKPLPRHGQTVLTPLGHRAIP